MKNDWVIETLQNVLNTWNDKMTTIMELATQSPAEFKGGEIWASMLRIENALQAIGFSLLVLFFAAGVVKTCGSFVELKKPEHFLKLFVRFILAKAAITYAPEFLLMIFAITQGITGTIISTAGYGSSNKMVLPDSIVSAISNVGFMNGIGLSAISILCSVVVFALSVMMLLTVYKRFFKIFIYTSFAPIPLAGFAGEPTQNIGRSFVKKYAAAGLEGCVMVLVCIIFSSYVTSAPIVDESLSASAMVWGYMGELIINMLVVVSAMKLSEKVVTDMTGL
ncbi:MAG: hypothetical protein RSD35_07985 [Oscillospiraceae bacterium]